MARRRARGDHQSICTAGEPMRWRVASPMVSAWTASSEFEPAQWSIKRQPGAGEPPLPPRQLEALPASQARHQGRHRPRGLTRRGATVYG